jgi:hypothetical protein
MESQEYKDTLSTMLSGVDSDFNFALGLIENIDLSKDEIKYFQDLIDNDESKKLELIKNYSKLARGIKFKYSINLERSSITHLPEEIEIDGYLKLAYSEIKYLPQKIKVKSLDLEGTGVESIPDNYEIGGYLDIEGTNIKVLPKGLKIAGNFYLRDTKVISLPDDIEVKKIHLQGTQIKEVPPTAKIGAIEGNEFIENKVADESEIN